MTKIIETKDLKVDDLPRKNANWVRISEFALTWDPKIEIKNESSEPIQFQIPNEKSTAVEIRAYIYVQQRTWNHYGREIDTISLSTIHEAIELLREKLQQI